MKKFNESFTNVLRQLVKTKGQKYVKKPVQISAIQIDKEQKVKTLEGQVTGNPTDWIITGVEGQKYPCPDKTFKEFYTHIKDDIWQKKQIEVTTFKVTYEIHIPHGQNQILKASIGDWVVQQSNGNLCPVKPDIFKKTYKKKK